MTDWPLTIIRRGKRLGSAIFDYEWWQELPEGQTAEELRSVGYEVVEVIPVFAVSALAEDLERQAREADSPDGAAFAMGLRKAIQLIRETKTFPDG